jgi:hypothetical protein
VAIRQVGGLLSFANIPSGREIVGFLNDSRFHRPVIAITGFLDW